MLSSLDAMSVARTHYPTGKIQKVVEYKDLYLLQIFSDDPDEGEMDPFFSIDKFTGEFRDFSILTDGDFDEIVKLFETSSTSGGRYD